MRKTKPNPLLYLMLAALVCALLIVAIPETALADDGGTAITPMIGVLIEYAVEIVATVILTLIGVLGAWLTAKLAKKTQLANIMTAVNEVTLAAQTTVGELKQTIVDDLKAARKDGKLTDKEITDLNGRLITLAMEKLSAPAYNLLQAASVDVEALIRGAGENWINSIRD